MRSFARPRREVSEGEESARDTAPKMVRRPAAPPAAPRRTEERFQFFRSIYGELRKVTWPTKDETQRLTTIVVAASVAVGAALGGIDFIFTELVTALLSLGR